MSLNTWVMVGGWNFLDRFEVDEFLDKMEEAGAGHLAFGGSLPLEPDPRNYAEGPVRGQAPPPEVMAREGEVRSLFRAARDRGMRVYSYGTNPHAGGAEAVYVQLRNKHVLDLDGCLQGVKSYWGACASAPEFRAYYLGRIRDAHQCFPEVEGFLNDGPEFGYEIMPGFMNDNWNLFACFGSCCREKAVELGYDFEDLRQAAAALMRWLQGLDASALEHMLGYPDDPLDALSVAVNEPGIKTWFRFRQDVIASYIEGLCEGVKSVDPGLRMGVGSRLPAFTPLTGYDLSRLARYADFLLPKLYLWMGGCDGLYGTVYRWARTLKTWNPHLTEDLLFRFVYRLFGFELPGVGSLDEIIRHIDPACADTTGRTHLGVPFPAAFFTGAMADQVRTMIAQVGDAERVRPWFHTDHGGRVLTPQELDLALIAATDAGLTTYLYYCPFEPGNWEVAVKHGG